MSTDSDTDNSTLLAGRYIAVPESRELALFSTMLEKRGARVFRCPMVSIHDSPDKAAVVSWLQDFCRNPGDDLILLTGEGLRRLMGFAEREGGSLADDVLAALQQVRKITRGPKPGNALRKIGQKTDLLAASPTTQGVIDTLSQENLQGRIISVQLYGTEPNLLLTDFLKSQGATVRTVAPYVYADETEDEQLLALFDELLADKLDAFTFTSQPQVKRLFQVAEKHGLTDLVRAALNRTKVAAVGPVVADVLRAEGVEVALMPESNYFMKPLVRELVRAFNP